MQNSAEPLAREDRGGFKKLQIEKSSAPNTGVAEGEVDGVVLLEIQLAVAVAVDGGLDMDDGLDGAAVGELRIQQ